ncbi:MAG: prolyl aminopeptidase [Gammaproteobacteria bacterium]|nr:prolyl aminopeptidase [Gammaproteobacteria bacterium]
MNNLYPELQPSQTLFLDTGSQHAVYVEISGNPDGIPVIFLHGGPCSGTKSDHRRFFNPEKYRIILFDQRGCGRSTPFGEIENNTTQDLIADMERIRQQLGINQWLLFGGSWGGALALLYAQQHPAQVLSMIIRGVFLARHQDMEWFAGNGVNRVYPEQWQQLAGTTVVITPSQLIGRLWQEINSDDFEKQLAVATAWQSWNGQVALGKAYQSINESSIPADVAIKQVKMELHYALHDYFVNENQILDNCDKLNGIPATVIHGRYDLVCPLESGWQLHKALPQSTFIVLPNAGHITQHEEMIDALVAATDLVAQRLPENNG